MGTTQLLVDLAKCKNPYNCPHGRPVLVHLTNKDLEHLFKRIQDPHQSKRQQFEDRRKPRWNFQKEELNND